MVEVLSNAHTHTKSFPEELRKFPFGDDADVDHNVKCHPG